MIAKFTKGPWRWRNMGGTYCLVAEHGSRKVILTPAITNRDGKIQPYYDTEKPLTIVSSNDKDRLEPVSDELANAKLIELAPELFTATSKAQAILASYLTPGQTISAEDCINNLLGVLDDQELVKRMREINE